MMALSSAWRKTCVSRTTGIEAAARRSWSTIPYQNESSCWTDGAQCCCGEKDIKHARLIDDQHIRWERVRFIMEKSVAWLRAEQAMQCLGLNPNHLGHALGCFSSWGRQQHGLSHRSEQANERS
jgi:hypothetical protein